MRWTPVVFETATCGCLSFFGTNARTEQSDDHTIMRTAQVALSRRIALRHGAAPMSCPRKRDDGGKSPAVVILTLRVGYQG